MEKKQILEKLAIGLGVLVIGGGGWFWYLQLQSVLELLEMAYG